MRTLFFHLLLGASVCLSSCKKSTEPYVPYVRVNFTISPSDPQFNKLNVPGGWVYVTGGSRGIIVYRKSNDEFLAFDRHCPFQVADFCRVSVNNTQIMAKDTCCGSEFVLTDGSVAKEPANRPLLQYQTGWDGFNLQVFN
jgi:nitrite reductase/ring-hydroxylating ferredoxin subunit